MARFDNKVVLVSGGARGQGAAEARLLVAQGAKVVIGDLLDNQGQALEHFPRKESRQGFPSQGKNDSIPRALGGIDGQAVQH